MRVYQTGYLALAPMLALGACAMEHSHDQGGDVHHVRDPATEPCDASNWRALAPDLRECKLPAAALAGERLRRARLSDASLAGASLERADLFKAVLTAAVLTGWLR